MAKCRIPHPNYRSYRCYKAEGHDGNHIAKVGSRRRVYPPYLATFHDLVGRMFG